MKNKHSQYISLFIGFVTAFTLSTTLYLFIILDWSIKTLEIFAILIGVLSILVSFLFLMFYLFRKRIFKLINVQIEENLDVVQDSLAKSVSEAAKGNLPKSIESFNVFSKKVVGWFMWRELRVWIINILLAIFASFITISGSAVLIEQNKLIANQNQAFLETYQPHFNFTNEIIENDTSCVNKIEVNINGAQAFNKLIFNISFLEFEINYNKGRKYMLIPVKGRIRKGLNINSNISYLLDCNNIELNRVTKTFNEYLEEINLEYCTTEKTDSTETKEMSKSIRLISFIGMRYIDIFKERRHVMYEIEQTGVFNYMDKVEIDEIIDESTAELILQVYYNDDYFSEKKYDLKEIGLKEIAELFKKLDVKKPYAECGKNSYIYQFTNELKDILK